MTIQLALLLSMAFSAVAAPRPSAEKKTIRVRIQSDVPSMDWQRTVDSISLTIAAQLMRGLNRVDKTDGIKPDLATSHSYSKDGKTLTFKIRGDVLWSDGVPLKARHFVDSFERLLNPATGSQLANYFYDIQGARAVNKGDKAAKLGVHAEGDDTLVIKLEKPVTHLLSILTHPATFPVRKDLIEKHGAKWNEAGTLVVLGPYRLAERKMEKSLKLVPNEKFFAKNDELHPIELLVVDEDNAAINLFDHGGVDIVTMLPSREATRRKESVETRMSIRSTGVLFNKSLPPFSDLRVRRAFAHAISREQMAKLLGAGQRPNPQWVPHEMPGWDGNERIAYDPAKARKLLAEAGFKDGAGFPATTFVFPARDDTRLIAERLQGQLRENLGVKIELLSQDFKTYIATVTTKPPGLTFFSWGAAYPDPLNFLEVFVSDGIAKNAWKNPKYDSLIAAYKLETTAKARAKALREAESLLVDEDLAVAPFFSDSLAALVSPKVKGYDLVFGRIFFETLRLK